MTNIADSPFGLTQEMNRKGVDISSNLMVQWILQLVGFFAGTYGVELMKVILK